MELFPKITLGDYPVKIIDGDRGANYPKVADFSEQGHCLFLSATNVTKTGFAFSNCAFITSKKERSLRKGRVNKLDTVLTTRGTVGNLGYFSDEIQFDCVRINSGMVILRPDTTKLDSRFLYFALRSPAFSQQVVSFSSGSAQPQLPIRDLKHIALPLPDINTQRLIGRAIGALDDKIELNRQMNAVLEGMARAVFVDWFVDFGPTRRKMAGEADPVKILGGAIRPPTQAQKTAALFPDRLGPNGLPEGWEMRTLGELFDVTMGQSPPGSTYNEAQNGLPFFQGRRDFSFRFPTKRVYCDSPTRVAPKDWTLLSVRAPVGDINRAVEECCVGRGVAAFCHKAGLLNYTYYQGLELKRELASYDTNGTVFGSINQKQFKSLEVVNSGLDIMETFDTFIGDLDDKIRLNISENQTLAEMRDLLLPKLMSGEIRLREAE